MVFGGDKRNRERMIRVADESTVRVLQKKLRSGSGRGLGDQRDAERITGVFDEFSLRVLDAKWLFRASSKSGSDGFGDGFGNRCIDDRGRGKGRSQRIIDAQLVESGDNGCLIDGIHSCGSRGWSFDTFDGRNTHQSIVKINDA